MCEMESAADGVITDRCGNVARAAGHQERRGQHDPENQNKFPRQNLVHQLSPVISESLLELLHLRFAELLLRCL